MPEVKHVRLLLERALQKADVGSDGPGFKKLAQKLNMLKGKKISPKYLRENLWYQVRKSTAAGITQRKFSTAHLDRIARYVMKGDFFSFTRSLTQPLPEDLKKCIGHWWSMVRANSGDYILKAPINIYHDKADGKVKISLKGDQHTYNGTVSLRTGNIFCELHSAGEKSFYIILKVGMNEKANVLQGIFAGISGAGEPIGGRELFVQADEEMFDGMKWQRLPLDTEGLEEEVRHYFRSYAGNCLRINKVSRFSLDDLVL